MTLRAKLLLIFVVFAVAPALAAGVVNYVTGTRAVEELLRAETEARAARMARKVEVAVAAHERRLTEIAGQESLSAYVRDAQPAGGEKPSMTEATRAHLVDLFKDGGGQFEVITGLKAGGETLFRVVKGPGGEPRVETEDLVPTGVPYDESVWRAQRVQPLRAPPAQETYGSCLRTTVPVFAGEGEARAVVGALVLEMKLKEVLKDAAEIDGGAAGGDAARPPATVVALDNGSRSILFHTNDAYVYNQRPMQYFDPVAAKMRAGRAGYDWFEAPEGDRWLVSFQQVEGLGISLAVAENYDAAAGSLRRAGLLGIAVPLVLGGAGVALLLAVAGRTTRRINRVAEAIAGGDFERHLDVRATGETRALAEGFNRMSDQLREMVRREAESKQFESFMRLSAMLTHDLKNAISGLALLVSNMEKHMHREEFRQDAVMSLRVATDKLKRIVARLNEPVKSLSGEYRRDARATDLVEVIKRVLAVNAEPSVPLYQIEARLPDKLVAVVEPERIENVIENLVINALEAMGAGGGKLTVEAGRDEGNLVFFSVADTGVGMNEDFIKLRLFRPFATTKQKGIGLGLFTCREIVEAHGGRLEVDSRPGVGTRFRVVLPSRLFASGERFKSRSSEGSVGH